MTSYTTLVAAYVIGGLTMIPLTLVFIFLFNQPSLQPAPSDTLEDCKDETMAYSPYYKVGYLQVTQSSYSPSGGKNSALFGGIKSYLNLEQKQTYFAVLKFSTLFLYDSKLQQDCQGVIQLNHYVVGMHPLGLKDHEYYSKRNWIHLKRKKLELSDYYLNCNRCVDKEDWYTTLMRASQLEISNLKQPSSHFDQAAMNHLILTIHSDPAQLELQWLNALLGRLFLSIYKTERTRHFFNQKILSKVAKLNARRPQFLEEITVRSVDGGHGAPYITQPRLVRLSSQGEYICEMHMLYEGGFRVELETVLKWTYSDRLPPIRIDLVLAITLKSIEGDITVKVKEPPTNRLWYGFHESPKMDWLIEPVVWEKRIGYSVVSKAIKSKIEEIFRETLELPNMDDIVFFATDGLGGLFDTQDIYESLPELYSAPSVSVVSSNPVPLLTSTSHGTPAPKKRWFNRTRDPDRVTTTITKVDASPFVLSSVDTPSQQTLRSLINNNAKRQKSFKNTTFTFNNLAAHVNHDLIDETVSIKKPASLMSIDALHSVRLSKKMLMEKPSRLRSKSLPSTGVLEINVPQNRKQE
ncbi:putative integral membrane protein conserved region-domain-containing protein [Sporodiniella umbellata]|nr:putative integral membrane protein conserved region-domain-containing protein [Sporodiniella umbellata]